MPDSALQPVSVAVFGKLNVPSLKAPPPTGAGCTGGVTDNPLSGTFPYLWYEVAEDDMSGLGAGLDVKRIDLRLHIFSTYPGMAEAQRIMREAIRLLRFQTLTVTGWQAVKLTRPFDVVPLPFEELNGVKVRELVSLWDLFVAEPLAWVQAGWIQQGWVQ